MNSEENEFEEWLNESKGFCLYLDKQTRLLNIINKSLLFAKISIGIDMLTMILSIIFVIDNIFLNIGAIITLISLLISITTSMLFLISSKKEKKCSIN